MTEWACQDPQVRQDPRATCTLLFPLPLLLRHRGEDNCSFKDKDKPCTCTGGALGWALCPSLPVWSAPRRHL